MATWDAQGIEIKTTNWTQWHTPGIPAWGTGGKRMRSLSSRSQLGPVRSSYEGEKRSRNKRAAPPVPSSKGHTKAEATSPPETGVK